MEDFPEPTKQPFKPNATLTFNDKNYEVEIYAGIIYTEKIHWDFMSGGGNLEEMDKPDYQPPTKYMINPLELVNRFNQITIRRIQKTPPLLN